MKKTSLFIWKHILLLGLLSFVFSSCSDDKDETPAEPVVQLDSFEPNNLLTLSPTVSMSAATNASLSAADDIDCFKMTGVSTGKIDQLKFTVDNNSDANLMLVIYNSSMVEIAQVPFAGATADLSYTLETNASEFYVQVVGKDATTYPANYSISATFMNAADQFEPNNEIATAATLALNTEFSCNFLKGDDDYYKVQDTTTDGVWDAYQVVFTNKATALNPSVRFYDESKTVLESPAIVDAGAGKDTTKTFYMKSGASNARYMRLYSNSQISALSAYKLKVKKMNVNEASEPNNSFTTAALPTVLSSSSTITGTIVVGSTEANPDLDYIKVEIPAGYIFSYKVAGTGITYDTYLSFSEFSTPSSYYTNLNSSSTSTRSLENTSSNGSIYYYLVLKSTANMSKYTITVSLY